MLVITLSHSFGSGYLIEDLDEILYSLGGYWNGMGSINGINSWIDSPFHIPTTNPRQIAYNTFKSINDRLDDCLAVPMTTSLRGGLNTGEIAGECVPGVDIGTLSLEVSYR
jgi:hypothetical protein